MVIQFIKYIKKYILIFICVVVVLVLNIIDISKKSCDVGECLVEASLDAGQYGDVFREEISLEELKGVKFITVNNASFFRVLYSPQEVSSWYYSTSFPSLHSTKLHKVFQLPDLHEVSMSSVKERIIVEANVVTNFDGCIELDLITNESVVDSRCIQTSKNIGSYLVLVFYLLLPILLIAIIIFRFLNHKDVVAFESVPIWFEGIIEKRGINTLRPHKDYWLLFHSPISIISILLNYQTITSSLYLNNSLRSLIKNILLLSINGYFKLHRPRLVITFIDNSAFFLRCAKMNPGIKFLMVQNGFRSATEITNVFGTVKDLFNLNNVDYLCYSDRQKELFKKTLLIDKARILMPFGSAIWKHLNSLGHQMLVELEVNDGVNYVSQWADFHSSELINLTDEQNDAKQNLVIITSALREIKARGVEVNIILRTGSEQEKLFFKDRICADIGMVDMSVCRTNSYFTAFESRVLLAMSSSLAIEAEMYGVYVLMLNPVSSKYFDTSHLVNNYMEGVLEPEIVDAVLLASSRKLTNTTNKEVVNGLTLIELLDNKLSV